MKTNYDLNLYNISSMSDIYLYDHDEYDHHLDCISFEAIPVISNIIKSRTDRNSYNTSISYYNTYHSSLHNIGTMEFALNKLRYSIYRNTNTISQYYISR